MQDSRVSSPASNEAGNEQLSSAACRAISKAALRLGVDPLEFARWCADGQIADLILDLRLARHGLEPADKQRVEELLQSIGGLP